MKFRSLKDRLIFYSCLSTMLQSGMPFERSLATLMKTMEEDSQAASLEVCSFLHSEISRGVDVANSFQAARGAFPEYAAGMIRAAQETGRLDVALLTLARIEEKEYALREKLKAALRYPLIIAFVGLVIIFVMASFLSDLRSVFEELGADIPGYLQAMIAASKFFQSPLVLLVLIALGVWGYRKLSELKFQKFMLNIPVFSRAIRLSANIHFCRLLGMQLEAGCHLLPALTRALKGTGDPLLILETDQNKVGTILYRIKDGFTLSDSLERCGYFSSHLVVVLRVAEEHGMVDKTLLAVADFLQDEMDYRLAIFASLVEPIFIVLTGLGVGLMAVGTFVPLLQVMKL